MTDERTPIDAAIDDAERKDLERRMAELEPRVMVEAPVLTTPHAWNDQHEITLTGVPGEVPTILVWDGKQGAWRGIFLPDGSTWRVVPDRPTVWTPDGER